MTFSAYLKSAIWDFVLTAAAAISLAYILLDGFYVAPELRYSPAGAAIVAVLLALLFVVAYNRRTALFGGIGYCAGLIAMWVAGAATSPVDFLVDAEGNNLIFLMAASLVATMSFLLTRQRTGTALYLVIGAFLACLMQFFYGFYELAFTLLFLFSALALIVYRNYQSSLRSADSVGKVGFLPGFALSALASAVVVGCACGIWFGIVAPLNPPAVEVKLVTEYRALETLLVHGTSGLYLTPNTDLTSDNMGEGERTTDDLQIDEENGVPTPAHSRNQESQEDQADNTDSESSGTFLGIDLSSLDDLFDPQSTIWENPLFWIVVALLVVLVAGYFAGRRMWRTHRLKRFAAEGPEACAASIYLFLMSRFARMGVKVPDGQTLAEFAVANDRVFERFDEGAQASFAAMTDAYTGLVYGRMPFNAGDLDQFERYYHTFWKSARKYLGNLKYFAKSFRL